LAAVDAAQRRSTSASKRPSSSGRTAVAASTAVMGPVRLTRANASTHAAGRRPIRGGGGGVLRRAGSRRWTASGRAGPPAGRRGGGSRAHGAEAGHGSGRGRGAGGDERVSRARSGGGPLRERGLALAPLASQQRWSGVPVDTLPPAERDPAQRPVAILLGG